MSAERFLRESGDSDGSRAASEKRQQAAAVHEARLRLNAQEPKFATESTNLFGLVFREAGPVVLSAFEVMETKVASSVTEGVKRMAFVTATGCFFGFTTGEGSGKSVLASIG